jgi:microsomal dipeptidase-like Zn-dependent dipeptidase
VLVLRRSSRALGGRDRVRTRRKVLILTATVALVAALAACRNDPTPGHTGGATTSATTATVTSMDYISHVRPQPSDIGQPLIGLADIHSHMFASYGFDGSVISPGPNPGDACLTLPPPLADDVAGVLVTDKMGAYDPGHCQPHADNLLAQQMTQDEVLRAHEAGLNLLVVDAVNNSLLCGLLHDADWRTDPSSCDDMRNANSEISAAQAFQKRIDDAAGGPGQGWFRIVTDPEQARSVIRAGKLAVVLGLEVSNPLCTATPVNCDRTTFLSQLDQLKARGVRAMFPMHIFDNMLGGAAMNTCTGNTQCWDWEHFTAAALSLGAQYLTDTRFTSQHFPAARNCSGVGVEIGGGLCNENGLSPFGQFALDALTSRGILIETDHMSTAARDQALAFLSKTNYPAVSSHDGFLAITRGDKANESNMTAAQLTALVDGGGVLAPILNQGNTDQIAHVDGAPAYDAQVKGCESSVWEFAQALHYAVTHSAGRGVAFGSDFNGFAGWPGPCTHAPVKYGHDTVNGVVLSHTVLPIPGKTGEHSYDIALDGFQHIGMLPDFLAQLARIGTPATDLDALEHGAEAYIETWERAQAASVPEPSTCVTGRQAVADAAAHHQSIAEQIIASDAELNDPTNPHPGKPTPEHTAEHRALEKQLRQAREAFQAATAAYTAIVTSVRADYVAGRSPRVCMTEDPPNRGTSGPTTTTTPTLSTTTHTPMPRPTTDPVVCRHKPWLPQC